MALSTEEEASMQGWSSVAACLQLLRVPSSGLFPSNPCEGELRVLPAAAASLQEVPLGAVVVVLSVFVSGLSGLVVGGSVLEGGVGTTAAVDFSLLLVPVVLRGGLGDASAAAALFLSLILFSFALSCTQMSKITHTLTHAHTQTHAIFISLCHTCLPPSGPYHFRLVHPPT